MLDQDEFKSMWEIAFLWEGMEPPKNAPSLLSDGVKKKIEKLIWACRRDRIVLRHSSGMPVSKDDLFEVLFFDWTIYRLNRCLKTKVFPYSLLSKRYAYRAEILKWCEDEYIEPPEFWLNTSQIVPNNFEVKQESSTISPEQEALLATLVNGANRHKNAKFDSMICQTIARTLWNEYPNMTIEDIKKHKAIQIYGNGRAYTGKNTLRDWLSQVDPRSSESKSGRKKKNSPE